MVGRRAFLKWLGVGSAALVLPPWRTLAETATEPLVLLPTMAPAAPEFGLSYAAAAVLAELKRHVPPMRLVAPFKLGMTDGDAMIRDSFCHQLLPPPAAMTAAEYAARYLVPIGRAFAQRIAGAHWSICGTPEWRLGPGIDTCLATDRPSGLAVRVAQTYDPFRDDMLTRFDMVGG